MRLARWFVVRGLVPLLCLTVSSCGAGGDAVVASVAGKPISSRLLDHWTSVQLIARGNSESTAGAQRQALSLLILWQWTLGEARAIHVGVTTGEADKQLVLTENSQNSGVEGFEWFRGESRLKPFLANQQVSQQDQLTLVKMGMLAARVSERRVAIAEARIPRSRVVAYYHRNSGQFWIGERRDIKAIMNLDRAKVVKAKHEMEKGMRFHLIEERFNTSIEGGLRLGRARGTQEKRYEKDYFAAPPHHLIGPLHEILYYVFEVFYVRPAHRKTVAEAEPTIRRRLAARSTNATATRAYEGRWLERTVCRVGYFASSCGSYSSRPSLDSSLSVWG
jgi:hypothetical protein